MNEEQEEGGNDRNMPISDIDAQFMVIDPAWGKEVTAELNTRLKEFGISADGKIKKEQLWGLLSYYTRDLRLGYLGDFDMFYCQKYLDFAGDCLRENYVKSFMTSLSRTITVLELSQSRKGFLRNRLNTLTQEKFSSVLEPKRDSVFSFKKKNNTQQYNQGGNIQ